MVQCAFVKGEHIHDVVLFANDLGKNISGTVKWTGVKPPLGKSQFQVD